jgi:glycosyltransferase involved in cell wall biosynthesis
MPKISFIIPVYNAEKYLERCLESIRCQSDGDFEAVLIDDGSTDSSKGIYKKFADSDARFICKTQKNSGASAARNAGISLARGEYIAFVDADDYIDADYVETLYPYAKETGADMVHFGFRYIPDGKTEVAEQRPKNRIVAVCPENLLKHFCADWLYPLMRIYVWSKLLRRDFITAKNIRFNTQTAYAEDRNFCYKVLTQSERTAYFDFAPYFYFTNTDSITHTANDFEKNNIFAKYLFSCFDVFDYWKAKDIRVLDAIRPVIILRALQAAMFNAKRSTADISEIAKAALKAIDDDKVKHELETQKVQKAIEIFAELCGISLHEQNQMRSFYLSLLDGDDGIIAFQRGD